MLFPQPSEVAMLNKIYTPTRRIAFITYLSFLYSNINNQCHCGSELYCRPWRLSELLN